MMIVIFLNVPDVAFIVLGIAFMMAEVSFYGLGADGVEEAAPLLRVVAIA
ncbi:MAG: hypothetical protein PHE55_18300 [Methylococcaceae bacterium]|nr:hypothetical protein [Methylococcaceae bacterium]MDD5036694.1 hypothetical protein [Methylococcaceae bacterium]